MKKIMLSLMLALTCVVMINAHEQVRRQGHPGRHDNPEQMIEKRLQVMTDELQLTPQQQTEIKEILTEAEKERAQAREANRSERKMERQARAERRADMTRMDKRADKEQVSPEVRKMQC